MPLEIDLTFSDYLQIFAICIPIITLIIGWFLDRADSRRQFRRNKVSELYEEFLVSINKCRLSVNNKKQFNVDYDRARLLQVRLSIWANKNVSTASKRLLDSVKNSHDLINRYKEDKNLYEIISHSKTSYATEEERAEYIDELLSMDWDEREKILLKAKASMDDNYNILSEGIIKDLRK